MIEIKNINHRELPAVDSDCCLKKLSSSEQEKIYGGRWHQVDCAWYFIK
jgi:hypothetical protein